MAKYQIGDKSKAICDKDGLVSTTLAERDINFKQAIVKCDVFTCDVCGEVVSTPAQSTEAIKFAFQEERERIDLAKVTLPMSEGPSWRGTIEEIAADMAKEWDRRELEVKTDIFASGKYITKSSIDEYLASERLKKALESETITLPYKMNRKERRAYLKATGDTLIAMQKELANEINKKE